MKPYADIPEFIPEGASSLKEGEAHFKADPIAYAQAAYTEHGDACRMQLNGQEFLLLKGAIANEFVWSQTQLWSYETARPGFLEEMGPEHVTSMDGKRHRMKRKIINKAFSLSANMRFIPVFQKMLNQELASIAGKGPIDFSKFWAVVLSKINFATTAQFDLPEDLIERLTIWQLELMKGVLILNKENRDFFFEQGEYQNYKAEAMDVFQLLVEERLKAPEAVDDNFKLILDARKELGEPWDIEALVNELYYITVAGVQNTTHFVNTALRELYNNEAWLSELQEELTRWDGDPMAIANLEKLKATLMEMQRLRPQVVATPLVTGQPSEFEGFELPTGTWVLHMPGFLHFDKNIYEEPFTFKPQRFLDKGKFAPKTFGFFGGGAHVCVGRNITQLHAPLILANALKNYRFDEVAEPDYTLTGNIGGPKPSTTMRLESI